MAKVSIEQIRELRAATGLSVNDVKNALESAGGDGTKAMALLKTRGAALAEKKSSREVKEGVISAYIHSTKKLGAIIELLCETDFVARGKEYQDLAYDLAMHIAAMKPANTEQLLEQEFIKDPSVTIKNLIQSHIAKLGENIQIGRFDLFEI